MCQYSTYRAIPEERLHTNVLQVMNSPYLLPSPMSGYSLSPAFNTPL